MCLCFYRLITTLQALKLAVTITKQILISRWFISNSTSINHDEVSEVMLVTSKIYYSIEEDTMSRRVAFQFPYPERIIMLFSVAWMLITSISQWNPITTRIKTTGWCMCARKAMRDVDVEAPRSNWDSHDFTHWISLDYTEADTFVSSSQNNVERSSCHL